MNSFAERLTYYRKLAGLNQKDLAEKISVSTGQISKYERGLSEPRPDILAKIAAALNTPVENFLDKKEGYKAVGYDTQLLDSIPRLRVETARIKKDGIPYDQKALDCYLSPEADKDFIQEAKSLFFNYFRKRFGDDYDMTKILEKYGLDDIQIKYKLMDDEE